MELTIEQQRSRNIFLRQHGLNFTVSKRKSMFHDAGDSIETPFYCTVNDSTKEALGAVKSKYVVKQNADLLDIILYKIGEGNYDLFNSSAGTFNNGRKVYFFIKHKTQSDWGQEQADNYIYALSSHDGSQRLVFGVANKIHSCSNMFGMLMNDSENKHMIKHTKRIDDLRYNNGLDALIQNNFKGISYLMRKMQEVSIENEIQEKVLDIVANSKAQRLSAKYHKDREALTNCIAIECENKGNTLYGLFNGVTNFYTHHAFEDDKLISNITGSGNKKITSVVKALVNDMKERGCLN